jgi:hypothetical protein
MEDNFTIRVPVAQGEIFLALLGATVLERRVEDSRRTLFVEWTCLCGGDASLPLNEFIKVTLDPSDKTALRPRCSSVWVVCDQESKIGVSRPHRFQCERGKCCVFPGEGLEVQFRPELKHSRVEG